MNRLNLLNLRAVDKGITELLIRRGIDDISKIIFLILYEKNPIHCDPSLELSRRKGPQCMVLQTNKENYPCYPFLSGLLDNLMTFWTNFTLYLLKTYKILKLIVDTL